MKILYDLGQYEPEYVEFEISSVKLDAFMRVMREFGKPVAVGQTKSIGRKRSVERYVKSLLKKVYSASYFEKRWKRVRDEEEQISKVRHKSIGFSGACFATDEALYLDKKKYVAYMLKQQKKVEKKNELINYLLSNFYD